MNSEIFGEIPFFINHNIFSSSSEKIGKFVKILPSEIYFSRVRFSRFSASFSVRKCSPKNNFSRRKTEIYPPSIPQSSPIIGANERMYPPEEIVSRSEISSSEISRISTSETLIFRFGISKSRHFLARS